MPEHERCSLERRGRDHAMAFDRVRVFDRLFRPSRYAPLVDGAVANAV